MLISRRILSRGEYMKLFEGASTSGFGSPSSMGPRLDKVYG